MADTASSSTAVVVEKQRSARSVMRSLRRERKFVRANRNAFQRGVDKKFTSQAIREGLAREPEVDFGAEVEAEDGKAELDVVGIKREAACVAKRILHNPLHRSTTSIQLQASEIADRILLQMEATWDPTLTTTVHTVLQCAVLTSETRLSKLDWQVRPRTWGYDSDEEEFADRVQDVILDTYPHHASINSGQVVIGWA